MSFLPTISVCCTVSITLYMASVARRKKPNKLSFRMMPEYYRLEDAHKSWLLDRTYWAWNNCLRGDSAEFRNVLLPHYLHRSDSISLETCNALQDKALLLQEVLGGTERPRQGPQRKRQTTPTAILRSRGNACTDLFLSSDKRIHTLSHGLYFDKTRIVLKIARPKINIFVVVGTCLSSC
jgi:hypothetical protein